MPGEGLEPPTRGLQDQDQVPLIDSSDASGKAARRHDALDYLLQPLDGGCGQRVAQTEVVHHDVHAKRA